MTTIKYSDLTDEQQIEVFLEYFDEEHLEDIDQEAMIENGYEIPLFDQPTYENFDKFHGNQIAL